MQQRPGERVMRLRVVARPEILDIAPGGAYRLPLRNLPGRVAEAVDIGVPAS